MVKPLSFFNIHNGSVMSNPVVKERIIQMANEVAAELGYMIYNAAVLVKGENSKVVVKLDHIKGISLNDCEAFSKMFSTRLDDAHMLPNYALEVSSPGIKRQLRNAEEYARFKGSPAKIIYTGEDGQLAVKGYIGHVGDSELVLETGGGEMRIEFGKIKSANIELDVK